MEEKALQSSFWRLSGGLRDRTLARFVRTLLVAVCVAVLLIPGISVRPADAATSYFLDLWPEMDTFVNEQAKDTTYGLNLSLISGYWQYWEMGFYHLCILLQFDFSLLPSDAVLIDAYLILYLHSGGGRILELMLLEDPWDHRTASWNNQPRPVYPSPGMNVTWDISTTVSQKSIDVSSWALGWYGETIENNGLTVRPYEWMTSDDRCLFYSQEGASVEPDEELRATKMPKLRVSYTASAPVPQPDPPDPPPWIDDIVPPQLSMTIAPTGTIRPTDTVTITVQATDDSCLDSVTLNVDWVAVVNVLVPYSDLHNTSILAAYETTLSLGAHHIHATAQDRMSHLVGDYERLWVGSNTPPQVMIRFSPTVTLPEDNTVIEVTVEASDAEGLKSVVVGVENGLYDPGSYPDHSESVNFAEPYPTTYTWTVAFTNKHVPNILLDPLNATGIMVGARVMDAEMLSATAADYIDVVRPYQWDYGIPYTNPGNNHLGWQRMEDAFGHGELWGPGGQDWWHTAVAKFWKPIFSMMASNGECFGMSLYSLWHYYNDVAVPDSLTEHIGDEEAPYLPGYEEWRYAKRTIEMWQGAQISQELLSKYISQVEDELRASRAISPFMAGPFQNMLTDLAAGRPGIVYVAEYRGLDEGITECVGAHAMVPYFAREIDDGLWQVYVYDSNRETASTCFCSDVENFEHYPYILISEDGYAWAQLLDSSTSPVTTESWNDFIWYISYEDAMKQDYDLIDGWLVAATVILMIVVTAITLATVAPVLITISHLLPIPLPLPMGTDSTAQSIALPAGGDYTVNFTGQVEGEYSWAMASGYSNFAIQNRSCGNGSQDVLLLGLGPERTDYGLRFRGDLPDDDFMIGIMHKVGSEHREYSLLNVSMGAGGDLETYASSDGDSLVLANHGDSDVTMRVLFRSSREVGQASQDITVEPGMKVTITADWDDLTQPLEVTTEDMDGSRMLLYGVVIISAVIMVAAIILTALSRRAKRGGRT
ncbi:MAG: DNRLRE domain-containing protein [Candidatus Thermoplasmatota archaeon]|nr:DNRLRE domain-containing protein [Candidatus Thermoplasmatota archaeon]